MVKVDMMNCKCPFADLRYHEGFAEGVLWADRTHEIRYKETEKHDR